MERGGSGVFCVRFRELLQDVPEWVGKPFLIQRKVGAQIFQKL